MTEKRFLLLRVPSSGPKALAGPLNDFSSLNEAEARLRDITSENLKAHHTYLEIIEYTGDKVAFLNAKGILA